jgi:ABC-type antimicrobial peptide transport system permease subunit
MPAQEQLLSEFQFVSPGYFRAMGIPLIRGRFFTDQDVPVTGAFGRVPVVIINESFAREQWPEQDPLGQTVTFPRMTFTVVGVVGDVRQHGMRRSPPKRQMYVPLFFSGFARGDMHYVILRTRGDPANVAAMLKDVLREIDPLRSLKLVRTMKQVVANNTAWDRLNSAVASLFGILADLLTLIGIYGVVARAVLLRTKEIGIRLALGSRPRDVVRLIVKQGMRMVLLGLPAGHTAAWLGARCLSSQLFGVNPIDIRIYAGVTILLLFVALAASCLPALRAAKIAPVIALRCD